MSIYVKHNRINLDKAVYDCITCYENETGLKFEGWVGNLFFDNLYFGEDTISLEDLVNKLKKTGKYKKVLLNLENAIKKYILAFEKKQGLKFNDWIGYPDICDFSDSYFNFQYIVFDVDMNSRKGLISEWYDLRLEQKTKANYINFTKQTNG